MRTMGTSQVQSSDMPNSSRPDVVSKSIVNLRTGSFVQNDPLFGIEPDEEDKNTEIKVNNQLDNLGTLHAQLLSTSNLKSQRIFNGGGPALANHRYDDCSSELDLTMELQSIDGEEEEEES